MAPPKNRGADIHRRIADEAAELATGVYLKSRNWPFPALRDLLRTARDEHFRLGMKKKFEFDYHGKTYRARIEGFDRVVVCTRSGRKLASSTCWAV